MAWTMSSVLSPAARSMSRVQPSVSRTALLDLGEALERVVGGELDGAERGAGALARAARLLDAREDAADDGLGALAGLGGVGGELADLGGDDGEALALHAGAGGLHARVEREELGLARDLADERHEGADLLRGGGERLGALDGAGGIGDDAGEGGGAGVEALAIGGGEGAEAWCSAPRRRARRCASLTALRMSAAASTADSAIARAMSPACCAQVAGGAGHLGRRRWTSGRCRR